MPASHIAGILISCDDGSSPTSTSLLIRIFLLSSEWLPSKSSLPGGADSITIVTDPPGLARIALGERGERFKGRVAGVLGSTLLPC